MYTPLQAGMVIVAKELLRLEVAEHPPGSNRGEIVSRILRSEGVSPGQPWCNAFWRHVYHIAADFTGRKWFFQRGGSTRDLVNEAADANMITMIPLPGDAACYKGDAYGTGYVHTAMVLTPVDKYGDYLTIEGNIGDGVKQRKHNVREAVTFVRCE